MSLRTIPNEAGAAAHGATARRAGARAGLYAAIIVAALFGAFFLKLRLAGIFACPAAGYAPDRYLADCQASSYGDYDHGALWFALEPVALRNAAAADVLFIGSSRLQLAMSNRTTEAWFDAARATHFMLGFSHSETVVFLRPLLERLQPRAKAVVINVDRVFSDRVSPPMQHILHDGDALSRYREKRFWQKLHAPLCAVLASLCGDRHAVYRARSNGAWHLAGRAPAAGLPVTDAVPTEVGQWPRFAHLGAEFIARLPVRRECVVLTLVPSVDTRRAEAEAIAAALGMELVSPRVPDLTTFDGSHLDAASAERWAAAFFEAAGPRLRACLSG